MWWHPMVDSKYCARVLAGYRTLGWPFVMIAFKMRLGPSRPLTEQEVQVFFSLQWGAVWSDLPKIQVLGNFFDCLFSNWKSFEPFGNVLPTYSVWHIFIVANDKYLNINYPSGDAGGEVKISHMTWSVQSVPNFRVEWLFYNFWPKFYWITHSSDIISVLWWERFSNI